MTREGRQNREANAFSVSSIAAAYYNAAASLYRALIRIEGLDGEKDPKSDYITGVLLNHGAIAREKLTGMWLPFYGNGELDAYGFYDKYTLFSEFNGKSYVFERDQVEIYRANPQGVGISNFLRFKSRLMADYEVAKRQNLDGVKQMSLIVAQSEDTAKKLQIADKKRRSGESVAILKKNPLDVSELSVLKTGAEYLVDRLQEGERKEWEELLHFVGVYTPREKGERKITGEIDSENSEVDALSNITVKTFNEDCEYNGTEGKYKAVRASYYGTGGESEEEAEAQAVEGGDENGIQY